MKTALTPESLHLLEQSLPWCTPLKGSSVQSRCTWWVGWASPASSPSGAWMLPRTCGKTAAGCHETRWPAHGRCCPETRPRSGWPAHPRLPHTKNSDSEDSCNMLVVWLCGYIISLLQSLADYWLANTLIQVIGNFTDVASDERPHQFLLRPCGVPISSDIKAAVGCSTAFQLLLWDVNCQINIQFV